MTTGELLSDSSSVSNVSALTHLQNLDSGGGTDRLIYVRGFQANKINDSSAKVKTQKPSANTSGVSTAKVRTNTATFIKPTYKANKEIQKC